MDVSLLIVNYNTRELLRQCLASIIKETINISYEIIVIDNDSSDGSLKMIKTDFPEVKIIKSNINLGFGKANNLGIAKSSGKYIFLLNSDTILLNNAVLLFFRYMETYNSDESIGAIGGILLDSAENPTFSSGEFPTIRSEFQYLKKKLNERIRGNSKNNITEFNNILPTNVEYITGADLFISKKIFDEIGVFDPRFFMYYEETDLQKRMADRGYKRLIIPGPRIIHLEGGSINSVSRFSYSRFSLNQKSLHIYIDKHFKGVQNLLFRLCIICIRLSVIFDARFKYIERFQSVGLILSGKK